jgi:hypothetical protein
LTTGAVFTSGNLLPESLTAVANFPPVSLRSNSNVVKDVTTGVIDIASKFAAGLNDTGGQLAADVADTGGAP